MVKLVGICVALFLLAVGVVIVTQGHDLAALFGAFRAEPLLGRAAWALIVIVPLVLLPSAVWLCDTLVRQRTAANALELRLDGVRQGVKQAAQLQIDAEAAVHHLARADPENAIGSIQQRLTVAERAAQVQESRNEIGDLQSRVDALRAQQHGLKDRLAPVLEKRRSIERLFLDLDTAQNDVERALAEISSGDDAVTLDLRLKNMMEFVRLSHERCEEIDNAAKSIAGLKEDYAALRMRLAPFAAAEDGVVRRVKELSETRDRLAADIDSLQCTSQGSLAERVQSFTDEKTKLGDGIAQLNVQFSKLATLRKDVDGLLANFDRALDVLSIDANKDGNADLDSRVEELSTFIKTTQDELENIEDRMVAFGQLKAKLGELQSRVVPLESDESGIVSLIGQVQGIRDKLVAKIVRLEEGDNGDLAERVKTFTAAKRELEERVSAVTEHFSKLATVRKDLAGLFEKLSSAANTASN